MHILANPIDNENTASSRIRCYRFLQHIGKEHLVSIGRNENSKKVDLYYVQKLAYIQHIKEAVQYRINSVPIVYDIDDDFGVWPDMYERAMLDIAHTITTDTVERKYYLEKFTTKPICVIPDAIDYIDDNNNPAEIRELINIVGTFGGADSIKPYFEILPTKYKMYYISSLQKNLSEFSRIEWKLNNFIDNLKTFDVCILAHKNTLVGNMKSNNRLLVCMSIGLPCIVSNTVAYSNTMKEIGLEMLIANEPSDVSRILENISDINIRKDISNKFRTYAWNNYHPEKSSKTLENLFKQLVKNIHP